MSMSSRSSIAKRQVLTLYRECLRSAHRIPDGSQRATYLDYTRQGFRDRAKLPPDSSEALRAKTNAEEQLERMNYYHSIRDIKEQTKDLGVNTSFPTATPMTVTTARKTSRISDTKAGSDKPTGTSSPQLDEQDDGINAYFSSGLDQEHSISDALSSRLHIPKAWLSQALPDLLPSDLDMYSNTLVQDGFDSMTLLENDIIHDDLNFMKKAHKRALVRYYNLLPDSKY